MNKLFSGFFLLLTISSFSQTLFVPSGTSGIGASTNGNVGVGTGTPSNIQGWDKVLDVRATNCCSKILATTINEGYRTGMYSHTSWNGGGGFIGTESNHNLFFLTNYDPKMIITTAGQVGIGNSNPTARLDVYEGGGATGQFSALRIRSGNSFNYFGNSQILFSYNGGTGYSHAIKTRHNSGGLSGNAIDFYVWKPGDALDAIGSNLAMTLDGSNVGIGTSSPGVKLVVNGLGGANTDMVVNGRIQTGDASNYGGVWVSGTGNMFMGQANTSSMGWYNNGSWRMIADNTGNIGIGTLAPTQKLTVNGTIYGKEVKVDLSVPGPDYVFDEDYKLTPLEDIKTYIAQNKHLPEVPSAKELEKNGIQLGEMNMLLLKKIEELTLYIIDLKQEVEALKAQKNK